MLQVKLIAKSALAKYDPDENGDLRLVTGIVLEPDVVDAQNDTYNKDETRKASHAFMAAARTIGVDHDRMLDADGAVPVESWIAPSDMTIAGQPVKAGSWVMTVRVADDAVWKSIKSGKLTGWSIAGFARRQPAEKSDDSVDKLIARIELLLSEATTAARTATAKSEADDEDGDDDDDAERKVHRLSSIDVHEVSAVGRAANKKKFLTIKNDTRPATPMKQTRWPQDLAAEVQREGDKQQREDRGKTRDRLIKEQKIRDLDETIDALAKSFDALGDEPAPKGDGVDWGIDLADEVQERRLVAVLRRALK